MTRARGIGWSLAGWLAVGAFWLIATRNFHPSWALAAVTTGALVCAYAAAFYVNHFGLLPRYWRAGRYGSYAAALAVTMASLTAAALTVVRACYVWALGPDPEPNGLYVHYGIDLFGMAVHLLGAETVAWLAVAVGGTAGGPSRPTAPDGGSSVPDQETFASRPPLA
jgi:hypothetical protein